MTHIFDWLITDTGVVTYAVHPGLVATEMGEEITSGCLSAFTMSKFAFLKKTSEQGAQTTLHCALGEALADQRGLYFRLVTYSLKYHISHNVIG
jgi:hypothetical protein